MSKECGKCKGRVSWWEYYDLKGKRICRSCWEKLSDKDKHLFDPPWWLHLVGILVWLLFTFSVGGLIGILILIFSLAYAGKGYERAKGLKQNAYLAYFARLIILLGIFFLINFMIIIFGGI